MAALLSDPDSQALFTQIRKGEVFPQVTLTIESPSGTKTGWARCCGFNINQNLLFCLPLHKQLSLTQETENSVLVAACPTAGISLHFQGQLSTMTDPKLGPHFWKRLSPIVDRLGLERDQLFSFKIDSLYRDSFCC